MSPARRALEGAADRSAHSAGPKEGSLATGRNFPNYSQKRFCIDFDTESRLVRPREGNRTSGDSDSGGFWVQSINESIDQLIIKQSSTNQSINQSSTNQSINYQSINQQSHQLVTISFDGNEHRLFDIFVSTDLEI